MENDERLCFKDDIDLLFDEDGFEIRVNSDEVQYKSEVASLHISILEKIQDAYIYGQLDAQEYVISVRKFAEDTVEQLSKILEQPSIEEMLEMLGIELEN